MEERHRCVLVFSHLSSPLSSSLNFIIISSPMRQGSFRIISSFTKWSRTVAIKQRGRAAPRPSRSSLLLLPFSLVTPWTCRWDVLWRYRVVLNPTPCLSSPPPMWISLGAYGPGRKRQTKEWSLMRRWRSSPCGIRRGYGEEIEGCTRPDATARRGHTTQETPSLPVRVLYPSSLYVWSPSPSSPTLDRATTGGGSPPLPSRVSSTAASWTPHKSTRPSVSLAPVVPLSSLLPPEATSAIFGVYKPVGVPYAPPPPPRTRPTTGTSLAVHPMQPETSRGDCREEAQRNWERFSSSVLSSSQQTLGIAMESMDGSIAGAPRELRKGVKGEAFSNTSTSTSPTSPSSSLTCFDAQDISLRRRVLTTAPPPAVLRSHASSTMAPPSPTGTFFVLPLVSPLLRLPSSSSDALASMVARHTAREKGVVLCSYDIEEANMLRDAAEMGLVRSRYRVLCRLPKAIAQSLEATCKKHARQRNTLPQDTSNLIKEGQKEASGVFSPSPLIRLNPFLRRYFQGHSPSRTRSISKNESEAAPERTTKWEGDVLEKQTGTSAFCWSVEEEEEITAIPLPYTPLLSSFSSSSEREQATPYTPSPFLSGHLVQRCGHEAHAWSSSMAARGSPSSFSFTATAAERRMHDGHAGEGGDGIPCLFGWLQKKGRIQGVLCNASTSVLPTLSTPTKKAAGSGSVPPSSLPRSTMTAPGQATIPTIEKTIRLQQLFLPHAPVRHASSSSSSSFSWEPPHLHPWIPARERLMVTPASLAAAAQNGPRPTASSSFHSTCTEVSYTQGVCQVTRRIEMTFRLCALIGGGGSSVTAGGSPSLTATTAPLHPHHHYLDEAVQKERKRNHKKECLVERSPPQDMFAVYEIEGDGSLTATEIATIFAEEGFVVVNDFTHDDALATTMQYLRQRIASLSPAARAHVLEQMIAPEEKKEKDGRIQTSTPSKNLPRHGASSSVSRPMREGKPREGSDNEALEEEADEDMEEEELQEATSPSSRFSLPFPFLHWLVHTASPESLIAAPLQREPLEAMDTWWRDVMRHHHHHHTMKKEAELTSPLVEHEASDPTSPHARRRTSNVSSSSRWFTPHRFARALLWYIMEKEWKMATRSSSHTTPAAAMTLAAHPTATTTISSSSASLASRTSSNGEGKTSMEQVTRMWEQLHLLSLGIGIECIGFAFPDPQEKENQQRLQRWRTKRLLSRYDAHPPSYSPETTAAAAAEKEEDYTAGLLYRCIHAPHVASSSCSSLWKIGCASWSSWLSRLLSRGGTTTSISPLPLSSSFMEMEKRKETSSMSSSFSHKLEENVLDTPSTAEHGKIPRAEETWIRPEEWPLHVYCPYCLSMSTSSKTGTSSSFSALVQPSAALQHSWCDCPQRRGEGNTKENALVRLSSPESSITQNGPTPTETSGSLSVSKRSDAVMGGMDDQMVIRVPTMALTRPRPLLFSKEEKERAARRHAEARQRIPPMHRRVLRCVYCYGPHHVEDCPKLEGGHTEANDTLERKRPSWRGREGRGDGSRNETLKTSWRRAGNRRNGEDGNTILLADSFIDQMRR